jgi:ATP-dependent Clp protease ATP-binding subunit ClpA
MFKGELTQLMHRILSVEAHEEACRFNSDQLLPEHIIIAILKDGTGTACKALMSMRIDLSEFKRTLERTLPHIPDILIHGTVPPSRRTKAIVDMAAMEAKAMSSDYLGTEHLLFAAMKEQDSSVQLFLSKKAINMDLLRVVIQSILYLELSDAFIEKSNKFVGIWQNGAFKVKIKESAYVSFYNNSRYGKGTIIYGNDKFVLISSHARRMIFWTPFVEIVKGKYLIENDELTVSDIEGRYSDFNGKWVRLKNKY